MRICWYGHAAFRIETQGISIIMDPYNHPRAGGYAVIGEPADVVTISHVNPDYHSDLTGIPGAFRLLNGLEFLNESRDVGPVTFRACRVFEDDQGRGPNAMIRIESEGLQIAHMGDCGHALERHQRDFLRGLDVLLATTGGPPTIQLNDLVRVIQDVQPRMVIPMHYKTPRINLDILGVDQFESLARSVGWTVRHVGASAIDLPAESPEPAAVSEAAGAGAARVTATEICILEPAR